MNTKFKKVTALVFAFLIVAFLVVCFFLNTKSFTVPFKKLSNGEINATEFISEVKSSYIANVKFKEEFININGFFARVTGRNHYNEVTKLKNGMLTTEKHVELNMSGLSSTLTSLDKYIESNGMQHLYVQAPYKLDLNSELLPTGTVQMGNKNADELLKLLGANGVDYLDLRGNIVATPEDVEKYFFKTDHHWNNDGAFYAFQLIMNELNAKYPNANIDMSVTDKSNWNIERYEDCFLGSHGKRVGIYYAGLDDYDLYTPKFETDMSMYVVNHRAFFSGDFSEAIVTRKEYLTNKDFFNETPYVTYVGGDFTIVKMRNPNAASNLRVLFIKDSYTIPVASFMSTAFKEVITIDPRYVKESTIAECIETMRPDIVITMMNPSVFAQKKYQDLGVSDAVYHSQQTKKEYVVEPKNIEIVANKDTTHKHIAAINNMASNTKYTISFDDVVIKNGNPECITVGLYNATTKQFITSDVLDIEYCREMGKFEWTVVTPTNIPKGENVQIIIYAGRHSQTNGNHVEFTNLNIVKYSKP